MDASDINLSDTYLMIDIETLGTEKDAKILSIGAVKFDIERGIYDNTFHRSIDVDSGANKEREESEDTVEWWEDQEAEYTRDGGLLSTVLEDFKYWLENGERVDKFWAKSPEFDISILNKAYSDCGMENPFRYYDHCDVRTIYYLHKQITGTKPEPNRGTVDHNPLNDSIDQALGVLIALRGISENTN